MHPPPITLLQAVRKTLPGAHRTCRVTRLPASARTDVLLLHLPDGSERSCVLTRARPEELHLYRTVLSPEWTGAPTLLGAVETAVGQQCWLFLERLPERFVNLQDPAEVAGVFRHLGELHRRLVFSPTGGRRRGLAPKQPWQASPAEIRRTLQAFPRLAPQAGRTAAALSAGPVTLIHGDYQRWNLLWLDGRVRVLDWEHAAPAHPIWDLVMLDPEEPGWEGIPEGPLAEAALWAYHRAGPLIRLPWPDFLRLQQLARLVTAARRVLHHRARLATAPPGAVAVIRDQEQQALRRLYRLAHALGW